LLLRRSLPDNTTVGFVVAFIPEGQFKPYRSEMKAQQYYMRLGDSTQVINRAVLSTLFHPRPKAVFKLIADLEGQWPDSGDVAERSQFTTSATLTLKNIGTATAKNLQMQLTWKLPGENPSFPFGANDQLNSVGEYIMSYGVNVNPHVAVHFIKFDWRMRPGIVDLLMIQPDTGAFVAVEVYAEDQIPQKFHFSVDVKRLVQLQKLSLVGELAE